MIIGTAGHIDHGKTTLVRALTGVDTDRLPEEKRRGISIELGYAFLDAPDGRRLGFIDVPGHERLVHTMLAGATGIDHALVLVAADDGVMPQTREHFAVMVLLGMRSASFVITKTDRAEHGQIERVRAQITALAQDTPLADAPIHEVSAIDGAGVSTLRQHLFDLHAGFAARSPSGLGFRLAIDRVFVVEGTGTVVTGTVHAGQVRVGDVLSLAPGAGSTVSARVRSVHAQSRPVAVAGPGERCALGLAGIARESISRGQWLVSPEVALATQRIDVTVRLWPGEPRALRSGASVHVHLGASAVTGSVVLLEDSDVLAPGSTARAQLVLHAPMAAWRGDRVVLRDASASRTIAGGTVLDPYAPSRYRRTTQRLAELGALAMDDVTVRESALIRASSTGVDLARLRRASGLTVSPPVVTAAATSGAASGEPALLAQAADSLLALSAEHARAIGEQALAALSRFHSDHPEELGPDAARLRRLAAPRLPDALWRALLQLLRERGAIQQRGSFVHRPDHAVKLSSVDERIAQKLAPFLAESGFEGAWARDLARNSGESEALVRVAIARLAQRGELHQVVRDLVYDGPTMRKLAAIARETAGGADGVVTAARFRDATSLGRKRAIQILEYFDRSGLLRRVGDEHRLRSDSRLFID